MSSNIVSTINDDVDLGRRIGIESIKGQLLILRFRSCEKSDHVAASYSVCTAICNALQEPSLVNNGSIMIFGNSYGDYVRNEYSANMRSTLHMGLLNVLNVAVRVGGLPGDPMADAPLFSNSGSGRREDRECIFKFWNGVPEEAEEFIKLDPPFFFISCQLMWVNSYEGRAEKAPRIIPVFRKGDYYYICTGEDKAKVLRVLNPVALFFSNAGHDLLQLYLSNSYEGMKQITFDRDDCTSKTHEIYCVPKEFYRDPTDWDDVW
jgi:hypothetical protein